MQYLRLIFVNLNPAPHQPPIKPAAGKLRKQNIGFAGENQLDAAAAFADAQEFLAQSPGGKKISRDQPDGLSVCDVFAEDSSQFALAASWW